MTGSSGHKRVPIKFYEELEIPLLNIAEQKSFVTKIEKLEKVISNANSIIDSSNEKKQIILDKYLKQPTLKAIHICNSHKPKLKPKIAKEYVFANAE